jgi:predicted DsbA family dithiol-disulfide isomerase
MGAEEGAEFHFDRVRGGNTFDAHRLVQLAADRGLQDAMIDRLMRANFAEGEAIADPQTLERLAVEAGLDALQAREVLLTDRYGEAVREDERLAASVGITGVPCFVVDRRLAVSGAQPPEVLLQLLTEGRARAA